MRLFRRKADPRLEAALAAHAGGDFARVRELAVEIVADGKPSLLALRGLAELEYLQGDYEAAEPLLRRVVEESGRGARGEIGYGQVGEVRLGPLTARAVPVSVMDLGRPVIGDRVLAPVPGHARLSARRARPPAAGKPRVQCRRPDGALRPLPAAERGARPLSQPDASGLHGIFPDLWTDLGGVTIHGILSHGFLRRYAWTLDFDAMTMTFTT